LQQVNMPKKNGTSSIYKGVCYYAHKKAKNGGPVFNTKENI